jgi:endonuclease/exonuclease/phosphatase family metal-dependent hydrolase
MSQPRGTAERTETDRTGSNRPLLRIPAVLRWLVLVPWAVWAVVRLFGLERGVLPIELMSFTTYVAAASLVPLVLILLTRDRWAIIAAVLVCAALGAAVLPRAIGRASTRAGPTLTVMSMNMRLGNASPGTIVNLVRTHHVDVLALQEYSPGGDAALVQAGLLTLLPHAERDPIGDSPGSAVYSRLSISDSTFRTNPGGFRQARATVHVGDIPVIIESVHPAPPVDADNIRAWATDLRAEAPADPARLHFLIGDFNSTVDHAELRRLIGTGYTDAASAVGAGLTPTWPFDGPEAKETPKITLDHILVNGGTAVRDFTAVTVPLTDHRAIMSTLVLPAAT